MAGQVDALAFVSSKNKISDTDVLNNVFKFQSPINQRSYASLQEKQDHLNQILNLTKLKRACCLGVNKIRVRIPVYPNAPYDPSSYTDKTAQKFKYYDKYIDVTPNLCANFVPQYDPKTTGGANLCEDFFSVYC